MPLNISLLDDSGIDAKYYDRKDVLIHTIMIPVLKHENKTTGQTLILYGTRTTKDLLQSYDQQTINKLDRMYAIMIEKKLILSVKPVNDEDIDLVKQSGYIHNAVFSIFKDEWINNSPLISLRFEYYDPKTYILEHQN